MQGRTENQSNQTQVRQKEKKHNDPQTPARRLFESRWLHSDESILYALERYKGRLKWISTHKTKTRKSRNQETRTKARKKKNSSSAAAYPTASLANQDRAIAIHRVSLDFLVAWLILPLPLDDVR